MMSDGFFGPGGQEASPVPDGGLGQRTRMGEAQAASETIRLRRVAALRCQGGPEQGPPAAYSGDDFALSLLTVCARPSPVLWRTTTANPARPTEAGL